MPRLPRRLNLRRWLLVIFLLSVLSLLYNLYRASHPSTPGPPQDRMRRLLTPHDHCPGVNLSSGSSGEDDDLSYWGGEAGSGSTAHVLLVTRARTGQGEKHQRVRAIGEFLVAVRIKYKTAFVGKQFPELLRLTKTGKYHVVVFDDMRDYYTMARAGREVLDNYCRTAKVIVLHNLVENKGKPRGEEGRGKGGQGKAKRKC